MIADREAKCMNTKFSNDAICLDYLGWRLKYIELLSARAGIKTLASR